MSLNPDSDNKSRDKSPARAICDPHNEQMVRELVKKRGIVKSRLTRFTTYVLNCEENLNALTASCRANLKLRVQGAMSLYIEFNDLQTQIETLVLESNLDDQLTQREQIEDCYYDALARAESMLNSSETTISSKSNGSQTSQNIFNSVRLPTIALKTFDGKFENWLAFRDTYLSLVHNSTDLCDIQKFHYLKSSLVGSALLIIDALELTTANYSVAWELLLNRFDNNRLLIHNHVRALFTLKPLLKESYPLIRDMIDTTLKNLRALKTLQEPTESWDTLIIYLLVSKLDKTTEREWEQYKSNFTCNDSQTKIKLDDLLQFLKNRADMLEALQASQSSQSTSGRDKYEVNKKQFTSNSNYNHKVHCNVSTNIKTQKSHHASKLACAMCKMNHPLYSCIKFLNVDYDSKLRLIKDNNLCENCLRTGHTVEACMFGPCRKCNRKHNSIIHPPSTEYVRPPAPASVPDPAASTSAASIIAHCQQIPLQRTHESLQPVLLSTALVEVTDKYNNNHIARVLLDNGSQRCFVTKALTELLDAPLVQSTHEIRGVGNSVTQCTQTCDIRIKSRISSYSTNLHCFVLPQITSTMPIVYEKRANFCIPDNIQLADPQFLDFKNIDILIGADKFWDLLTQSKIRLRNGPYLLNSKLGWIISGSINLNARIEGHIQCHFTQTTDSLLRRFWEIEELPAAPSPLSDEEKACEEHFVRNTTRNSEGRFCVSIPLKQSPEVLGETYPLAERRFLALEKRLQRSEALKKLYADFIHEYEELGHMNKVTSYGSPHFILPHHGVLREHSTTTKLRTVFQANIQSSSGVSLNDLQMVGPAIQGDLLSILLRFRLHRYVACADVAKMYRQILIHENQRDLQLILWRDNPHQPISIYRINRLTYGLASSAFLSVRCLKQLAIECNDPHVKRIINEDFYVDDMITGSQDKNELLRLCGETARTLQSGCFPLRKWIFNFDALSLGTNLPTTLENTADQYTFDKDCSSKTLGIAWNNYYDNFHFNSQLSCINNNSKITKRSILSHISQIFDPVGILSPTIMQAKVLLQRLWLLKVDWDQEVPSDVARVWIQFTKSLSALSTIRVPRYVVGIDNYTRLELHIFSDASQTSYGACIYIRAINNDNSQASSRLLCSKGKVAPLKVLSCPRLELCGALLGARLYDKVIKSVHCRFDEIVFWSDSTIVLGWLRMQPNLLKTFVQNRVAEIHELTSGLPWRHVSGKENPADLVSRSLNLEDLASSSLWWNGPSFLQDAQFNINNLTQVPNNEDAHDILPEVKNNLNFTLAANAAPSNLFAFERFSQFSRLTRAAAYVLRFIHNTRNKNYRRTGSISVEELRKSTELLTRLSQLESFPEEYKLLVNKQQLKSKHHLSKYNLFTDENDIMRVGGRIGYSQYFSYDKKHPILITSKHRFTQLLFQHKHKQLLHAAPQALLFELHDTWWPVGGRNLARKVFYDCVVCRRVRGRTLSPLMGNLPQERITPTYPYLISGVDYAGPVFILNRKGRGAQTSKAYICLFVCFVTRAIHLELVSDLTTGAYLLALKRFIARRGKPSQIFSDNGRHFVGLMHEFSKFLANCSDEIIDYATSQNIKFSFIPPYAAHFGALWEAGVKSCKFHLRRVVGNANLTFEEFNTVLTQIEAVLNSRPLSPMSSDPNDYTPLSPGHFLVGRPLTSPATDDLQHVPLHRLDRYRRVEQIRQHFWERWAKEYVSELQTRVKWRVSGSNLEPNTLVLIKDDNLPPLKWHLGRVIQTIPGKDGVSRVANIRTSSGIVRRAYTKICPLVDPEPEKQDGAAQENLS